MAVVRRLLQRDLNGLCDTHSMYSKSFNPEIHVQLPKPTEFNHAIRLKEGAGFPFGLVYSLSQIELETLREYYERM